jgi:hypothetical protein
MGELILNIVSPILPLYPALIILTLFGFAARPIVRRLEMDEDKRTRLLRVLGFFHTALLVLMLLVFIGAMWSMIDAGRAMRLENP